MNYLSHSYFNSASDSPELVLGSVLPDMVRTFSKDWILKPEQHSDALTALPGGPDLLKGWRRHKAVDQVFHASEHFKSETSALKIQIKPLLSGSRVWAFFLAHIFYELNLDALLLRKGLVDVYRFYSKVESVNRDSLLAFMAVSGELKEPERFLPWLDRFCSSHYLSSYIEDEKLVYALDRICQGLWKDAFSESTKTGLTALCASYREHLSEIYADVMDQVRAGL